MAFTPLGNCRVRDLIKFVGGGCYEIEGVGDGYFSKIDNLFLGVRFLEKYFQKSMLAPTLNNYLGERQRERERERE